jgi:GTP-binding protein
MPQTRFVLKKALESGLRPIVVVNKVDRNDSRPHEVVNEVFDLFVELGADDHALDFPVLFASAKDGWASDDPEKPTESIQPVFDAIVKFVPPPTVVEGEPLAIHVTALDYSDYVGRIAVGKITSGSITPAQPVAVIDRSGKRTDQRVMQVLSYEGLGTQKVDRVDAGDICAVVGLDPINISDVITCTENPRQPSTTKVDEPTLHMTFRVNDGPFAGREGRFVTSRQIAERLERELRTNVALHVSPGRTPEEFNVSGRGLMHLGILLENMRREGFELCAGRPKVIFHEEKGRRLEPIERLVVTCPVENQSAVMSLIGSRRADMVRISNMAGSTGYVNMEFEIPARGLIGLAGKMLTATQGNAIMHHNFLKYDAMRGPIPGRQTGVIIASHSGTVTSYALKALADRGVFFVEPGEAVYEGQIVGEHCMDKDIAANVAKAKQKSNMRSAGRDQSVKLRPKREMSLETALEYIQDDELVEITPDSLRLRKRHLTELDRKRFARTIVSSEDEAVAL